MVDLQPDAECAAALDAVDPSVLDGNELLDFVSAASRQLAHQQAVFYAALAEVGQRDPALDGLRMPAPRPHEYSWDEVAWELSWSSTHAGAEVHFADEVMLRRPEIGEALLAGRLDRGRAWVLYRFTSTLPDAHAADLLGRLLPDAGERTSSELWKRGKRIAISLDPDWAARVYKKAVKTRRLRGFRNPDGTTTLVGEHLPTDQADAGAARMERLGALAKQRGYPGSKQHAIADAYLGQLEGRFQHLSDDEIVAMLIAECETAEPQAEVQPVPQNSEKSPVARVGVELQVRLSTLLGQDELPAEVAGRGPVLAPIARDIAAAQKSAQWRWSIVDETARVVFDGITRRRPKGYPWAGRQARGGIVELLVTETDLTAETPQAWSAVLADIRHQNAKRERPAQDPTARFADRPLRRQRQAQRRYCAAKNCQRPATTAILDHTREYGRGGLTEEENQDPLCSKHDGAQTLGRWHYQPIGEDTIEWTSPIGRRHRVDPRPALPDLPEPIPRAGEPPDPPPDECDYDGPIMNRVDVARNRLLHR